MPGKASSLKSPPLIGCYYLTTLRTSDFNDDYKESCYFNVDHFKECYYNVDNAEDSDFTDDQGVNETRVHIEKHPLRAGDQGPATPTIGPGQKTAPVHPKGPNSTKPEETTRQDWKGTTIY